MRSLRDREVAYSASDRRCANFESCVWRAVSFHSSHHPQEVLLAQFSLHVHKSGLKLDSFHLLPRNEMPSVGLLLGQCRRQWPNITLSQVQCGLFAGDHYIPQLIDVENRCTMHNLLFGHDKQFSFVFFSIFLSCCCSFVIIRYCLEKAFIGYIFSHPRVRIYLDGYDCLIDFQII